MKIIATGAVLQRAFERVAPATTSNISPILSHALVEAGAQHLSLTATDTDVSIIETVAASGDLEIVTSGDAVVPAAWAVEVLGNFKDKSVTLEVADGKVSIKAGKSGPYTRPVMPPTDFPVVPEVEADKPLFVMPQARLKEMLLRTSFAAKADDLSSLLAGVLFDLRDGRLHVVATDTYNFSMDAEPVGECEPLQIIVPHNRRGVKPLDMLTKLMGADRVTCWATGSQIAFDLGDTRLVSRVLDGQYPNYAKVIPTAQERAIECETRALREAVRGVVGSVNAGSARRHDNLRFDIEAGTLRLSAATAEGSVGADEVEVVQEGEGFAIAFHPDYVADALAVVDAARVRLEFIGALNPMVLRAVGVDGFLQIVMPRAVV